jgi:tetratricopeptide (TPR) repeat protein
LPADVSDFVGRDKQVARLMELLVPTDGARGPTPIVVSAIVGRGGVGKTALAVRVAHRLVEHFPDGQLYVNLRGTDVDPVDPALVLGRFLRVLGLDGSVIPVGSDERSELYRGLLTERRVLVVLDNAESAAQIRPLLPGTATCAVLVTSRSRLAELAGGRRLDLDVLDSGEALELVAAVVGPERTAAEPDAAHEIARLCGYLPLAVRIAAARLATRPHQPLARLAGRLADRRRRLTELALGDLDVRGSLALSYQALDATAARALRLLAALDAPDFAAWVAAPLLDIDLDEAEELVDTLADRYLLDAAGTDATGRVRYRFHDLVRLYARERGESEDPEPDRRAALARVIGAWLAIAESADARLPAREFPPIHGHAQRYPLPEDKLEQLLADPLAWFDAERGNLVAAVEQACGIGLDGHGWDLAASSGNFFDIRGHYDDGERIYQLALDRCRQTGNGLGEAVMLLGFGVLWSNGPEVGEDRCMATVARAGELFGQLAEPLGQAKALEVMAYFHQKHGRVAESLRCVERALAMQVRGHSDLDASLWLCRGFACNAQGDYAESETSYTRALDLTRRHGLRLREALVLRALGALHRRRGDHQRAESCLRSALAIMAELDHTSAQAAVLLALGQLQADQGHPDARPTLERALASCRRLGVAYGQALALSALGDVHRAQDRPDQAVTACSEALDIARGLDEPLLRAWILKALGAAHQAGGDHRAAMAAWREARDLHATLGNTTETDNLDALLAEHAHR